MNKQSIRHRRASRAAARTLAVAAAMATLVAILDAGQALTAVAVPDERVLERQGMIDRQAAAAQADEQGKAEEPSQDSSAQTPRRYFRPEPSMGSQFDSDEQLAPAPAPPAPASSQGGLVISLAVAVLLLAVGAATTWRIRHRRPRPEPTT